MKKIAIATFLAVTGFQTTYAAAPKLTLCVFDPLGARGDAFGYAKDYALQFPRFGMTNPIQLKAYTDERIASEDFKAGQCDGAIMTSLRVRQFNSYAGSLDAVGAVPSRQALNLALQALTSKQLAPKMSQGDYEVLGVIPLGTAYIMVTDRKISSLAKAAGKKVAVLDYDKSQAKMVQKMGAQPVSVDLATISGKFNNHQVDIIAGPAVIFKPFELAKGMTGPNGDITGAVIRFPLLQITAAMVVRKSKFNNPAANQKIREYVYSQISSAYKFIDKAEKDIDAKYWLDVPEADKGGYVKLMRAARMDLTKDGTYDRDMMHLLKKVRCKIEPAHYECALNDE